MMLRYRLSLEPDDNGTILVTSPDIPVVTYGDDEPSAVRNATDAIHAILASMMEAREAIRVPRTAKQSVGPVAEMPLQTNLKVALYSAMLSASLTRADLQRKLGWQRESVDRLFRLDHNSKIEQLDEAFRALGKAVSVDVRDTGGSKVAA